MEKTRQELLRGGEYSSSVPQIDAVVLLDRSVDFVAALSTQLTYEGLIDEFFGIRYSKLSLSYIKPVIIILTDNKICHFKGTAH